MSAITDAIKTVGHWDVSVRPTSFNNETVSYAELDEMIGSSVVRMRGWPVPFIDYRQPLLRGSDWIGQDIDAEVVSFYEAWRFFTSGQFAQLRIISADRRVGTERSLLPRGASSVIEVWEILYYLTELTELAARLSLSRAGGESMQIEAKLLGLKNRQLISGKPERPLIDDYIASQESLSVTETFQKERLISEPREIAIELSSYFFLRFGWKAHHDVLVGWQNDLARLA